MHFLFGRFNMTPGALLASCVAVTVFLGINNFVDWRRKKRRDMHSK